MFRALYEAFTDDPAQTQGQFISGQDVRQKILPNIMLASQGIVSDAQSAQGATKFREAIGIADPYSKRYNQVVDEFPRPLTASVSPALQTATNKCATTNLDTLVAEQGQSPASVRCGWLYQAPPANGRLPLVSQGALGTADGPSAAAAQPNLPTGSRWFWNLEEAQKQIEKDRCRTMRSCNDLNDDYYRGKCGYCANLGYGIPVNTNGTIRYPGDADMACARDQTITVAGSCPAGPATGTPEYAAAVAADPCFGSGAPGSKMSRDCLLQKLTGAGCNQEGALYLALRDGRNTSDLIAEARSKPAFLTYQQRANPALSDSVVKNGTAAASVALDDFTRLYNNTRETQTSGAIRATARDLCVKEGSMAEFDFCSELLPTSLIPQDMTCLQKAWKQAGGQETGTEYPSTANAGAYRGMANYGAFLTKVQGLQAGIKSTDPQVQAVAIRKFLGPQSSIPMLRMPYQTGFEIFWFVRKAFVGRQVINGNVGLPRIPTVPLGSIFNLALLTGGNNTDYVTMVVVTNFRVQAVQKVKFQITTDDGMFVRTNVPARDEVVKWGNLYRNNAAGVLSANFMQTESTYTSNQCTTLSATEGNFTRIGWYNIRDKYKFDLYYMPCSAGGGVQPGATPVQVPPAMLSLTQEMYAPFASFEVYRRDYADNQGERDLFCEYRNWEFFSLDEQIAGFGAARQMITSGIDYETRESNYQYSPNRKPYITLTGGTSQLKFPRTIIPNAYKTLTCCFALPSPVNQAQGAANPILFSLDPFFVSLNASGRNTDGTSIGDSLPRIEWADVDGVSRGTVPTAVRTDGTWYLLAIRYTSDMTTVSVLCLPVSELLAGSSAAGLSSYKISLESTRVAQRLNYLGVGSDANTYGRLTFGSAGGNTKAVAGARIAWFHMFDYELTNEQLLKDAKGEWIREWYSDLPAN
jgi:hypothetical protein